MIGHLVGNYKIIEKIGEGGMGDVFKGLDIMLEREVAIKMLRPELARQANLVERFRTEAVTLAKLNHPNIATLYNFVRQGNDYFMVMEYVNGHTFESLIKQTGAMPYQRAVQLFAQALDGIAHAHRLGVIHRDLKPANVMLMKAGTIKVMDFGIARVLGSNRITRTGNVIGTIEYMSPEQVRGEETDARSDIYSAGILLYEMLTGRVPFESNSDFELMRRQIEDAPVPPRVLAGQIPLGVEQVIMRALAKKPEARFQTADEFRAVLLKNIGEATAALVNQRPAGQAAASTPLTPSPKAPSKPGPPRKPMPTTLDFVSEPEPSSGESEAPDTAPAVLKETRLADEEKSGSAATPLKETRLANGNPEPERRGPYPQSWHDSSAGKAKSVPPQSQPSAPSAFFKWLNWKYYAAAVALALLSIPAALLMSPGTPSPANQNQPASAKKAAPPPEQRAEPVAPRSAPSSAPEAPVPAPTAPPVVATAPGETGSQDDGSAASQNKKPRRAASRQPAERREPAKKRDNEEASKKEDKKEEKKEKKGGLFGKVKGGLKKINPFKKD